MNEQSDKLVNYTTFLQFLNKPLSKKEEEEVGRSQCRTKAEKLLAAAEKESKANKKNMKTEGWEVHINGKEQRNKGNSREGRRGRTRGPQHDLS
jgi:hypothetical protein